MPEQRFHNWYYEKLYIWRQTLRYLIIWNIGPSHSIPLWNSYIKTDKKNKNIPLELQALVGMGLLADHSTVEAEQEEPWQDQAEGRPDSEEDRLGWSPAGVKGDNVSWEMHKSTLRKGAKCTRTLTAAGGGPVHCPGPATPPGGGWTPGFYMDAQTRTRIKTPSFINNLQRQQCVPCLGCSPDDRPAKR